MTTEDKHFPDRNSFDVWWPKKKRTTTACKRWLLKVLPRASDREEPSEEERVKYTLAVYDALRLVMRAVILIRGFHITKVPGFEATLYDIVANPNWLPALNS
jgi:hypothetical protein